MRFNKRIVGIIAAMGCLCVAVTGCGHQTVQAPGVDNKAKTAQASVGVKEGKQDEESPLKVQGVKYDLTESQIVMTLQNASKTHIIGGFEADMTAMANVNGQHERVKLDMKQHGGYIGFQAQNADGYIAYDATPLLGLILQPGDTKTVTLDFVGTLHEKEGQLWFDKKDSCNIERIMMNDVTVSDYDGKSLSYGYPDAEDMAPNYNDVKPTAGEAGAQVLDTKAYKVTMEDCKYPDGGTNLKLKFENKSDKDMQGVKLTYLFSNGYGVNQCFSSDIGDVKAGAASEVNIGLAGIQAYNLAPEFKPIIAYQAVK